MAHEQTYRAVVVLCADRRDGVMHFVAARAELPSGCAVSYVSDPRQLQGFALKDDVKVCRTAAFMRSPGRQEVEDALASRDRRWPIRFISADGVLYPVVRCGLQLNEDMDGRYEPRLHIVTAWGNLAVEASVEAYHVFKGRSTVFATGVRLLGPPSQQRQGGQ